MTRFKIVIEKHNDTHMLLENLIREREELKKKVVKVLLVVCTVYPSAQFFKN